MVAYKCMKRSIVVTLLPPTTTQTLLQETHFGQSLDTSQAPILPLMIPRLMIITVPSEDELLFVLQLIILV